MSVAAPSGTPTRITLAPPSGCFLGSRTTPESLPTVPAYEPGGMEPNASAAMTATLATLLTTSRGFMGDRAPPDRRCGKTGAVCRGPRLTRQQHPPGQRPGSTHIVAHPQSVRIHTTLEIPGAEDHVRDSGRLVPVVTPRDQPPLEIEDLEGDLRRPGQREVDGGLARVGIGPVAEQHQAPRSLGLGLHVRRQLQRGIEVPPGGSVG